MKPVIIAIGYNRADSIRTLLTSLNNAVYDSDDVKLIISIDHSKKENDPQNLAVLEEAKAFDWKHGEKEIIYREKNMGLRPHVVACGDLVYTYGSLIMLEDDIYVSPMFYKYACAALDFSEGKDYLAGVSLYNHRLNFQTREIFDPVEDGYDNWYFKFPQSWGQAWTKTQWDGFRKWYDENNGKSLISSDMPPAVSAWPETSWMKYFAKYMITYDKYLFFPKHSFTTNSCVAGTNTATYTDLSFQVPFYSSFNREFNFSDLSQSEAVYDQFLENVNLFKSLGIPQEKLTVDLYGHKPLPQEGYLLTRKHLDYRIEKSFACAQRPMDMNIINDIGGANFYLYNLSEKTQNKFTTPEHMPLTYDFRGLDYVTEFRLARQFVKHLFSSLKKRIKRLF